MRNAYQNYLFVRKQVLAMIKHESSKLDKPSLYWQEELSGFEYMLDASPLIINKLRHHCYHISGLYEYNYRKHHYHSQQPFKQKLRFLKLQDKKNIFVPESPSLGGFGFKEGKSIYNLDTLKFYEAFIALDKGSVLDQFHSNRKVILEIGSGWGGFAYQFKTLFPYTTYILVDFPRTFLFSATYLLTLFPKYKTLFVNKHSDLPKNRDVKLYDFIFISSHLFNRIQLKIDLAINMVSFQEMTTKQVKSYIKKLHALVCPLIYSLNRDKSPHNEQLTSVSSILEKYYQIREVKVLNVDYPTLKLNHKSFLWGLISKGSPYQYKHIIGGL